MASAVAANGTGGVVAVAVAVVALGGGIYAASRRNPVSALNVNDVPTPPPVRAAA
ncbi:hypothetical protein [Pseudonocardia xinjiangensis]|uniref:hypothetical protein n=1 Tax=Pseudonocardia xinjiangensis TaxID=75289 RepID=UPI001FE5F910|nr:hypothetical protein [Pseudonocardia xinjiangensis]